MPNYMRFIRLSMISLSIVLPCVTFGFTQNDAFQQGIKFAMNNKDKSITSLQGFKPKDVVTNYTDKPDETAYLDSASDLKTYAINNARSDVVGNTIITGVDSRNEKFNYSKDPNAKSINDTINKSNSVYDVITGQYGDCTKKQDCTVTYKNEICNETPTSSTQYCEKKLNVTLVPKQYVTHYTMTLELNVKDHDYAGVSFNSVTGKITFIGPSDAKFKLQGTLPANIDCNSLQGRVTSESAGTKLDYLHYPNCSNGLMSDLHISKGHNKKVTVDITSTKTVLEPEDHWINGCEGLEKISSCTLSSDRCLEENTSHVIDGVEIKRDCWQREVSYQCGSSNPVNTCQPLRDQGCEQTGSTCQNKSNGACTLYEQTYQCSIKQCTDVGTICNGETYCLDGNCVQQQKKADPDFQRSVSALSAANDAGKSFTNFDAIFTGQKKTCSKVFLGFIDCCADEGWGKDMNLAQCSPEEKDLAAAKENLQAVYLGEYCNKDPMGVCVERRKAYCIFPSKLARIIQVQGRKGQLGIGFGEPEHADCRGLTREEFVSLNLGKMDFSDFYSEITKKQKIENSDQLGQRVGDKVHGMEKGKTNNV